jgi:hypothetical protein
MRLKLNKVELSQVETSDVTFCALIMRLKLNKVELSQVEASDVSFHLKLSQAELS